MNSNNKNTRQLAGIAGLCLITILRGGTGTQAGAGIHKTATGRVKPKHAGRSRPIHYAAVSPDGRLGASYYGKTQIRIWNKHTGKLLRIVKHVTRDDEMYHYGGAGVIEFSRTGRWLLVKDGYSVGTGGAWPTYSASEITVWNTHTGRRISPIVPDENDSTYSFTFTPDDSALAYDCIYRYGTICTLCKINLNTGQYKMLKIFENAGDVNPGGNTYFTPDGKVYKATGFGPDCAIDVATFRPYVGKL